MPTYMTNGFKYQWYYSQESMKDLFTAAPTSLSLDPVRLPTCSHLKLLEYAKIKKTSLLVFKFWFHQLLKLYDSEICGNSRKSLFPWTVSKQPLFLDKELPQFALILIDNSISWKEELIVALERQKVAVL